MSYTAKAAQYKKDELARVEKLLNEYPVVGIVNVQSLPGKQLGVLRQKLRKDCLITMTTKQIIVRAINNMKNKEGFDKLAGEVVGMPALLLTHSNPFKIAKLIRQSKSKAAAKPGQVAPRDLIIPAGPTQFTPGPIISELGALGLKTGVENGKIVIKDDKIIAKEGDVITKKIADALAKFSIEPMEIGLDLVAAYESGLIYGKKVLSVDPAQYVKMLTDAAAQSFALTIEVGYPTKENISRIVGKAFTTAKNFALDNSLPSSVVIERDIANAQRSAIALASNVPEKKE